MHTSVPAKQYNSQSRAQLYTSMDTTSAVKTETPNVFADLSTHEDIKFLFSEPKRPNKPPVKLPIALRTIIQNETKRTLDFRADNIKAAIHTVLFKDVASKK